jgi:carbon monoxide dehydrogenase subunit G
MAAESFARELRVTADRDTCWEVLTDVERLASWVSVLHEVTEISRLEKYTAVLADKLGPMKLRAQLDVDVKVLDGGSAVHVAAAGRDAQVNSKISVDATLRLDESGDGTLVVAAGTYQVTGRVASMGGGIIRKKADHILEEFFTQTSRALGGEHAQPAGAGPDGARVGGDRP